MLENFLYFNKFESIFVQRSQQESKENYRTLFIIKDDMLLRNKFLHGNNKVITPQYKNRELLEMIIFLLEEFICLPHALNVYYGDIKSELLLSV